MRIAGSSLGLCLGGLNECLGPFCNKLSSEEPEDTGTRNFPQTNMLLQKLLHLLPPLIWYTQTGQCTITTYHNHALTCLGWLQALEGHVMLTLLLIACLNTFSHVYSAHRHEEVSRIAAKKAWYRLQCQSTKHGLAAIQVQCMLVIATMVACHSQNTSACNKLRAQLKCHVLLQEKLQGWQHTAQTADHATNTRSKWHAQMQMSDHRLQSLIDFHKQEALRLRHRRTDQACDGLAYVRELYHKGQCMLPSWNVWMTKQLYH